MNRELLIHALIVIWVFGVFVGAHLLLEGHLFIAG